MLESEPKLNAMHDSLVELGFGEGAGDGGIGVMRDGDSGGAGRLGAITAGKGGGGERATP